MRKLLPASDDRIYVQDVILLKTDGNPLFTHFIDIWLSQKLFWDW